MITNTVLLKNEIQTEIENGKNAIKNNPFYFTLHLLFKYYFLKQPEIYLMNFLKDITRTENEFKVFMVYMEFGVDLYTKKLKDIHSLAEDEDMIYIIISNIKNTYDKDRSVIKPFIKTISENEYNIIEKFNTAKIMSDFKQDALEKFNNLNIAISYLNQAKNLEEEAKKYTKMAIDILENLKGCYRKTIYDKNLFIKNV